MKYFLIGYSLWNIATFVLMGIDKYKAEHKMWRISEAKLLISAFAMGALGEIIGAYTFRHKTKKIKFKVLLPLAAVINGAIIYLIIIEFKGISLFT